MKKLSIFIAVLIITINPNAFAQNWNVVFVEINNYNDPMNNLSWCIGDAEYLRTYLINFKQWNGNNIALLTDVTESQIHPDIQAMPRTPGNTNLFTFSGHGNSRELDALYGGSDGDGLYAPGWAMITQSELQSDLVQRLIKVLHFWMRAAQEYFQEI